MHLADYRAGMDPFEDTGSFWLPVTPDRRVGGKMTFDGDGVALKLDEALADPEVTNPDGSVGVSIPWVTHPIVHGTLRERGETTLLGISGANLTVGSGTETWYGAGAIMGPHLEETTFTKASAAFDVLLAWTQPPPLLDGNIPESTLTLREEVLETAEIGDLTIKLASVWEGQSGGYSVDVRRRCRLRFEGSTVSLDSLLDAWIRPIQDMLIVLVGRPVRMTDLSLQPSGSERGTTHRVAFNGLQMGPHIDVTPEQLLSWGSDTMLCRRELTQPFADLVSGWFTAQEELSEATTLLTSPFYAPFMYSEHRYAATFQSAESIARKRYTGNEKAREEHAARVSAIVEAARSREIPEETVEWAERVLRSRNDKPLAALIDELVTDAGELGSLIVAQDPEFARHAASARTRVSHPGGDTISTEQRYWYGHVLLWLVRARLATEAGLDAEVVYSRIVQRGNFTQAVAKLNV
jgi:ApeA N-terminal domain 1/Apea-like HEPN